MIKIVYRVIKTRNFKGKDALKKAKKFVKDTKKKPMTDDVMVYRVDPTGGTEGYYETDSKWKYEQMDG